MTRRAVGTLLVAVTTATAILATVLAINLVGDRLRDALDPRV